jgi:hypothetical protein
MATRAKLITIASNGIEVLPYPEGRSEYQRQTLIAVNKTS